MSNPEIPLSGEDSQTIVKILDAGIPQEVFDRLKDQWIAQIAKELKCAPHQVFLEMGSTPHTTGVHQLVEEPPVE